MNITEVRVKLMLGRKDKLRAFCSITFDDCFVVRDFKVINGDKGAFVAMPSKKIADRCPKCHTKNSIQSNFCSKCGEKMDLLAFKRPAILPSDIYVDIAHPIKPDFRKYIQETVLGAFNKEIDKSHLPGYKPEPLEYLSEAE